MAQNIALTIEPGTYAVARGPLPRRDSTDPDPGPLRAEFRGAGEWSCVFPESDLPAEAGKGDPGSIARGWRWLRVEGPLPFTAVGILAAIAAPLARAEVPIFVVSSFDTDHVLVPGARLATAVEALRAAGFRLDET